MHSLFYVVFEVFNVLSIPSALQNKSSQHYVCNAVDSESINTVFSSIISMLNERDLGSYLENGVYS
jgi:hypothetical protein